MMSDEDSLANEGDLVPLVQLDAEGHAVASPPADGYEDDDKHSDDATAKEEEVRGVLVVGHGVRCEVVFKCVWPCICVCVCVCMYVYLPFFSFYLLFFLCLILLS